MAIVGQADSTISGHPYVGRRFTFPTYGLYFPAIVACQHNPVVKAFYQRMLQNGLTKKQAVCAAMRKLLHLIIGVLKSGKPFDPSLHNLKIT